MEQVGIRELRQNASKILARVKAGETVAVTDRGRAIARITPTPESDWDALVESGAIRPPLSETPLYKIRPRPIAASASDILEQLRQDER